VEDMTEPNQPSNPADHAAHDPSWMAALATRDPDLSPSERTRAQAALGSCGACADLLADLVALSAAIPSAAIPTRPRDFTLTAADAARLRPNGLRRLLKAIGSARDGVTFPLALGLTTMGIAGLLLATVPALSGMGGGATAGAAPEVLSPVGNPVPAPAAASAPAASAAAAAPSAAPAASGVRDQDTALYGMTAAPTSETSGGGEVFTGDDGDGRLEAERQDAGDMAGDAFIRDDGTGLSTLVVVAATLLIAGLGLFALRWSARRLGDG
jgi:hypothetical protein